jgi:rhamnulose-1-phosphate aldolase
MSVSEPYPSLAEIVRSIGEAGQRLTQIGACEGAAGNISVHIGWECYPERLFPRISRYSLPIHVPQIAGKCFIVTGSGRRLGEIAGDPEANLCIARINSDGDTAQLYTSPRALFERPTSEFNTHLALHRSAIVNDKLNFHAIVHAQPVHVTFLSQIPDYQNTTDLSKKLLRWEAETIINLPMGIAYVPFAPPSTDDLMQGTLAAIQEGHRIVLWAKHGVMARSDQSVKRAVDRIDYIEAAARYEYMNLTVGNKAVGLTDDQIKLVCKTFDIKSPLFPI